MGPAFYKPTYSSTATTVKYKGVHFGALRSSRMKFSGAAGPGPGDYNPHKDDQQRKQNEISALVNPDGKKYEARLPR